jgi:hypothetical protein
MDFRLAELESWRGSRIIQGLCSKKAGSARRREWSVCLQGRQIETLVDKFNANSLPVQLFTLRTLHFGSDLERPCHAE